MWPLRAYLQEVRETGVVPLAFRIGWEGYARLAATAHPTPSGEGQPTPDWTRALPFASPRLVADAASEFLSPDGLAALERDALAATEGRLRCFGGWPGDFGEPRAWYRNPQTAVQWPPAISWAAALASAPAAGDVKLVWELSRFPHFFLFGRLATFAPSRRAVLAAKALAELRSFAASAPPFFGIHWASAQEIALRSIPWAFALRTLFWDDAAWPGAKDCVARSMAAGLEQIARLLPYAEFAIGNNHALSDALGLYLGGGLLKGLPIATEAYERGRRVLELQAARQFYPDGGYIQQSHNYHREVMDVLLVACATARAQGAAPAPAWLSALDRSVDFLYAHQNIDDGRLPNQGQNDGSLILRLSTCQHDDFRPTLQAAAVMARGERLYDRGPWDEAAIWLSGAAALDAPLRPKKQVTRSFAFSGYHVLREPEADSFATFRCGDVRSRFGQIDIHHVDVWWRGQPMAIDAGTYQYGGELRWHRHFVGGAAHNSVTVDGRDAMLHLRRFKLVDLTKAKLLHFDGGPTPTAVGEHYGYRRDLGVIHRRAVVVHGEYVVVHDELQGSGEHEARCHWLLADWPLVAVPAGASMVTPKGDWQLLMAESTGRLLEPTIVRGDEDTPEGWFAPSYGIRHPTPSVAVHLRGRLPLSWVSVFGPAPFTLGTARGGLELRSAAAVLEIELGTIPIIRSSRTP